MPSSARARARSAAANASRPSRTPPTPRARAGRRPRARSASHVGGVLRRASARAQRPARRTCTSPSASGSCKRRAAARSSGPARGDRLAGDVHGGNVADAAVRAREHIALRVRVVVERDEIRRPRRRAAIVASSRGVTPQRSMRKASSGWPRDDAAGEQLDRKQRRARAENSTYSATPGIGRGEALQILGERRIARPGSTARMRSIARSDRQRLMDASRARTRVVAAVRDTTRRRASRSAPSSAAR